VKDDLVALFNYVGLEVLMVVLRGETIHIVGRKRLSQVPG
jgi:hypothetical protein